VVVAWFVGGGGVPSLVFMHHGAWPLSLSSFKGEGSGLSIRGRWLLFMGCGGAVVVVCEWSWAMADVFGQWWLFCVVAVVGHHWWGHGGHV